VSKMVTMDMVKRDEYVDTLIRAGNQNLGVMGYTEHGFRHLTLVSDIASNVAKRVGMSQRQVELTAIAGYMHDIGNVVNRQGHHLSGAVLAYSILERLGMPPEETITVCGAIGNHDEETGQPVSDVAACLILADKTDVHRTRVRNRDVANFDIHDRVNYAAERSFLRVEKEAGMITLQLQINPEISPVIDYFEIFMSRMLLCRKAANFLGCRFGLEINGNKLL
jgi:metal-dependent HD superfamily phosphatase/phosphodiesterase